MDRPVASLTIGDCIEPARPNTILPPRFCRMKVAGSSSSLELTITDNGKGFDMDSVLHAGLGEISIKERVESAGGRLEIRSTEATGTHVHVSVPIRAPEQALAVVPSA